MSLRTLQIGVTWPSAGAGGGERVLADLSAHLPGQGVDLETLVAGPVGPTPPEAGVSTFGNTNDGTRARWLGARRAVCDRLDSGSIDVVASHFALYASAALDRLRNVPHVVHFHGPWAAEARQEGAGQLSGAAKWGVERLVYASADRMIVLSEAFAAVAERDYRVPASRIRIVPGAADLNRFTTGLGPVAARQALGWAEHERVIVSVRRLVRRTGIDRLIDAMPAVAVAVPGVHLYVGGTGPLRSELEASVRSLGLERQVTFLGYVPDEQLPIVYRAGEINVLPTVALEGFGLTAAEALAVGTPSMVTPVGALPEVVSPLSPALVFASASPADIATGLIAALNGATILPDRAACQAYARARFAADTMARRVAAVYREVC